MPEMMSIYPSDLCRYSDGFSTESAPAYRAYEVGTFDQIE